MNSQNREEEVILDWFKDQKYGKFMDIGAFDPFYLSNTRCLIEKGFEGTLIEPVPKAVAKFEELYKLNDDIEIVAVAIDTTPGIKTFYEADESYLSTLSKEFRDQPSLVNYKFKETTVDSITPEMLFHKYGYDFDFIDLDVEGSNWDILERIPFDKFTNLSLICVEHKHDDFDTIDGFMRNKGFTEIYKDDLNIIYCK